jgi:WD40 repeat protein
VKRSSSQYLNDQAFSTYLCEFSLCESATPHRLLAVSDPPSSDKELHVRDSQGFAVGDNNTVVNYFSRVNVAGEVTRPHSITMSGQLESPYLGLKAFGERDAPLFFGRETAAGEILRRLAGLLQAPAPLVVSGVSGAGKSSLLRAGVLPWIGEADLASAPGARPWPHLILTATAAPLAELAAGVAALTGGDASALRASLAADPSSLALAIRQANLHTAPNEPGGLLLIIDQFEQVFTQCVSEAERRAFIAALHAAATTVYGSEQLPAAVVVLVVRADFEAQCAEYEELGPAVQERYLLRPMTQRQLRLAVTGPAEMLGSSVEPDLVEELVRAAAPVNGPVGAGMLPHLSHALDQAWRNRAGDTLTLADYERTGGIEGSIAASAERAYAGLTLAQQAAAQSVFMRLVTTSSDLTVSAGRAAMPELIAGCGAEDVTAVVEAFAAQRLLTVGEDGVEISHEVLLTAWERLRTWLDGDRIDLARYSRLAVDARDWDAAGQPAGYLYLPGRLEEISAIGRRWAAAPNRYPPLAAVTVSFLNAARRAARRSRRARRAVIAVLSALTLAAGSAAAVATLQASNANHQHAADLVQQEISLSRQLAAQSLTAPDVSAARQLAVAAWHVSPTSQAASAMSALLARQDQNGELPFADSTSSNSAGAVAFNRDGTLLATSSDDVVQLWDPATLKPVGKALPVGGGEFNVVSSVAFSPNGKLLAAADGGDVKLWNPATGKLVGTVPADETSSVAFSPTGALLAAPDDDGLKLWSVPGLKLVRTIAGDFMGDALAQTVAFNRDGTLLAAIEDNADGSDSVGVWRSATGALVTTLPASALGSSGVNGIAFDPEGSLLATGDVNGYVRLWNPATGAPAGQPLPADPGIQSLSGVAFSPDGALLASADSDGYVKLWNVATGALVGQPLPDDPKAGWVATVAFSPQRGLLASLDSGGTVRLWNVAAATPVGATLEATTGIGSFSAQASYLGPGTDGYVAEWSAAVLRGKEGPPPGDPSDRAGFFGDPPVTFSNDGSMFAELNTGGVRYGRVYPHTSRFLPAAPGKNNQVAEFEFTPDDRLLATGDLHTVTLWDAATGRRVKTLPATDGPGAFPGAWTFSPNGQFLATSSCGSGTNVNSGCSVTLWNVATGTRARAPFRVNAKDVNCMGFSPDGRLLAVPDGATTGLWNTATGTLAGTLPAISSAGDGNVELAGFSPDGRLLAAMYADGVIQLWNPATRTPVGGPLGSATEINNIDFPSFYFSANDQLLLSIDEINGEVAEVTPYPIWQFANPYAALCDEVGPPPASVWKQYAGGAPEPSGICAGVPPASVLGD